LEKKKKKKLNEFCFEIIIGQI